MRIGWLAGLLMAGVWAPAQAFQCQPVLQLFRDADAAFTGVIETVTEPEDGGQTAVTLRVQRAWKTGSAPQRIVLHAPSRRQCLAEPPMINGLSCDEPIFNLAPSPTLYLALPAGNDAEGRHVTGCTFMPLSEAEEKVKAWGYPTLDAALNASAF